MELRDLKQGMICLLRNGTTLTIVGNGKVFDDDDMVCTHMKVNYENILTHKKDKQKDIMKVSYGDKVEYERKESTHWTPEEGERYYYVDSFGSTVWYVNKGTHLEQRIFNTQLVFKTLEEAERALLKQQSTIRVIKEITTLNEGWTPNWKNDNEKKYYIRFSYKSDILYSSVCYEHKDLDNNLYLKSEYLAEQLIRTHQKDLRIMLEVEEND